MRTQALLMISLGAAAAAGRRTGDASSGESSHRPIDTLGGLFSLSGAPSGSITGRYDGNLSLLYLYRLSQLPPGFGDGLYVGGSLEVGNLWMDRDQVDLGALRTSASLFVGADTRFGPLYLALGHNDEAGFATYLFVGRSF